MNLSFFICLSIGFGGVLLSFKYKEDVILHNFFVGIALVSIVSVLFFLNKNQKNEIIK